MTAIRVLPNAITRPPHSIITGFEEGPVEAATKACKTSPIPAVIWFGDVIKSPNRSWGRFLAGDEDGMAILGDFEVIMVTYKSSYPSNSSLMYKTKMASDSEI